MDLNRRGPDFSRKTLKPPRLQHTLEYPTVRYLLCTSTPSSQTHLNLCISQHAAHTSSIMAGSSRFTMDKYKPCKSQFQTSLFFYEHLSSIAVTASKSADLLSSSESGLELSRLGYIPSICSSRPEISATSTHACWLAIFSIPPFPFPLIRPLAS